MICIDCTQIDRHYKVGKDDANFRRNIFSGFKYGKHRPLHFHIPDNTQTCIVDCSKINRTQLYLTFCPKSLHPDSLHLFWYSGAHPQKTRQLIQLFNHLRRGVSM
jgi:hypothetical protein